MVQNWENFMSPTGGQYDTNFATGGASVLAGIGIDMFAIGQVNKFTKINPKDVTGLKRRYTKALGMRSGGIPLSSQGREMGNYRLPGGTSIDMYKTLGGATEFKITGTDYYGNPTGEAVKQTNTLGKEIKKDFDKYKKQVEGRLQKRYGATKSMLKGASWTLLATGVAMMVEGVAMPGVTSSARRSDEMAMGMGGPMESQQAYTQRQRALMAIHDSQLGLRNVIGNEAGHFHR
jgi:hypothetical protein